MVGSHPLPIHAGHLDFGADLTMNNFAMIYPDKGALLYRILIQNAGTGETGIVVWKEPWDPCGWEVTKSSIQRWGWTVRNCSELLHSTNAWRRYRGGKPLFSVSEI
ncbi:hypothetical protein BDW75DRAFT_225735 [Aspergillus navahoensis]